jgi:uncharacterized Zn-finger protein
LYSWQICKNSFSHRNILSGHTSESRRETSHCQICVKTLSDNRNEVQRLRGHKRPFSCNIFNKGFTCRSNLDKHIRVHTGERQFSCEMCKKSFSRRCNLLTHLRIHTGERRSSCDVCKKKFARSSHVKCHVRCHSGEQQFSCGVCKKRFSSRSNLNAHLRMHSGERPFSCKICNKTFTVSSGLKGHLRLHSGELFSCHVCKKAFTLRYILNMHLKLHSEAWRFAFIFYVKRLTRWAAFLGQTVEKNYLSKCWNNGNPINRHGLHHGRWPLLAVGAGKPPLSARVRSWKEIIKFAFLLIDICIKWIVLLKIFYTTWKDFWS